jgi:hypothetical protein
MSDPTVSSSTIGSWVPAGIVTSCVTAGGLASLLPTAAMETTAITPNIDSRMC